MGNASKITVFTILISISILCGNELARRDDSDTRHLLLLYLKMRERYGYPPVSIRDQLALLHVVPHQSSRRPGGLFFQSLSSLGKRTSGSDGEDGSGCDLVADPSVDPLDRLCCQVRQYDMHVDKSVEGLECKDVVTVDACYGRCDSFQVADSNFPMVISKHPVCLHADTVTRRVRLAACHPDHPDPYVEVVEPTACSCRPCAGDQVNCDALPDDQS